MRLETFDKVPGYLLKPCDACPPSATLLLRAARDLGLTLTASWLLARDAHHVTAGQQAGCRTLLVGGGDDTWPAPTPALPFNTVDGPAAYQARDIVDAALAIVRLDGER